MSAQPNPASPILVVDDERSALDGFEIALATAGYTNIVAMEDSRNVLPFLDENKAELILLDLIMPHISGGELLVAIRRRAPETPVIIVSAVNEIDSVVECMRNGATDYILKPVEVEQFKSRVRKCLEFTELERENARLRASLLQESLRHPDAFDEIVTRSPRMCAIFRYCEAVAKSRKPILITGETGTGKELIARAIHHLSNRKGNFVAVNIAAFDDAMFADTLFGHVRGAFTGADAARPGLVEKAAGGTLFLDEIGDLPLISQVKLLRLLQEQEYFPVGSDSMKKSDVRILASTLKDLNILKAEHLFREDLYYRLITHTLCLPPLRERPEDIKPLLDHFLSVESRELSMKVPTYHPELVTLLRTYAFPGNIRELRAMTANALTGHTSRMLSSESFKAYIAAATDAPVPTPETVEGADPFASLRFDPDNMPRLKEATNRVAAMLIEQAMEMSGGNQTVASRILGISQQALSLKLKKRSGPGGVHPG
ncbi:sigma-54-dependent transcriptional regulator [Desulfolutivibrio sulfoxidireducens]|uniref:sigma-54-dependent transcriptional regulator n=1 Tax=Desulfolutivibrio sulfoxidireducens TaxID=2773299 RepID=UPI00159DA4C4|nr:sigma-54 dependent transcriptional regulator [Desulfolutivibrio sulfoxidireducens]QLA18977.1 response regulator [Desulfolutivibrio sulfoxidireducens]